MLANLLHWCSRSLLSQALLGRAITLSAIDGRNALHVARGIQCLNIDQHLWDGAFR